MADALMVVFSNTTDASREDEFNEWYTNVHLRDVLKNCPGFVAGRRYQLHDIMPGPDRPKYKYMIVYELEGNLNLALGGMGAAAQAGQLPQDELLDKDVLVYFFLPVSDTVTRDEVITPAPRKSGSAVRSRVGAGGTQPSADRKRSAKRAAKKSSS